jgi:DNA-binding transcriptional MerR regulator
MSGGGPLERKDKPVAEGQAREGSGRRTQKSDAAFRTISEVAAELDVPQHVLRFWETKFSQIRPMKRGGGRRYYRPEDVVLLTTLRDLLYREGYTIKGVQKLLRESGAKALVTTVQERQERAGPEGASLGPVGFALPEGAESEDSAGDADEERIASATPSTAGDAEPPASPALDEDHRSEIAAVIEELSALQGLLRQALTVARAPTPPPAAPTPG